jgi:hypothetical protein
VLANMKKWQPLDAALFDDEFFKFSPKEQQQAFLEDLVEKAS